MKLFHCLLVQTRTESTIVLPGAVRVETMEMSISRYRSLSRSIYLSRAGFRLVVVGLDSLDTADAHVLCPPTLMHVIMSHGDVPLRTRSY